jgi:hypothetical protein
LIEDVLIRRVNLGMQGGGTAKMVSDKVPENEKGYPDAQKFSRNGLPAYGFYVRHAQRVRFEQVRVTPIVADARPFMVAAINVNKVTLDGTLLAPWTRK